MARKILAILTIILGASISIGYLYYMPSHLTLSVADPPLTTYDSSITGIYVNFTEVDLHVAGGDNNSGWVPFSTGVRLNLMSVLTTSKVVSTSQIPPGKYDVMRFFTSKAIITINGTNTTYTIPSGNQTGIKVPIIGGGFRIYGGQTMTVQLDLYFNNADILNNPTMTLTPIATAKVA